MTYWNTIVTSGAVAALIAGLFTIASATINYNIAKYTARLSHDTARTQAKLHANVKLAEFRQQWIDDLRQDMSKFNSLAGNLGRSGENVRTINELMTRIELRMNPKDENFQALRTCMSEIVCAQDFAIKVEFLSHFTPICQDILKKEWDVLRDEVRSAVDA